MTILQSRRQLLATIPVGLAGFLWLGRPEAASSAARINKTPAEWLRELGPERFRILRQAGTERPYSSPLNDEHGRGTFACAGCALPLFASSTKFDSGTGWPSFYRPLPGSVSTKTDLSLGMDRTEVLCTRCAGHLGHVFPDGPRPTGLRYCMNGLALKFIPDRALG
ncbi:peptide-methionine (R)-S-oxide reductase MsrB [Sphingomonas alba]|uniref:peptide-methionine (R)-S-oxide reductase n=1 Tax=Sphingomonas alba TaxID=2908208 RepID=A0ABT0RK59_9SPHN|nr:peptide-methionine (R)-S-oxide reductase MsrB [Sphingomonas alba]MCL6683031.1 peptide-methionine (R)-S-oxide reductase MsrB [Sphingomonas alba]